MELKLNISKDSNDLSIKKVQKVTTSTFTEKEYEEMFSNLRQINLIQGNYKLNIWKVFDEVSDMPVKFSFENCGNTLLQKYLKWFVLLRLQSHRKPKSVYNNLQDIKKCILNSDGLKDIQKLEIYLSEIMVTSEELSGKLASNLNLFLTFTELPNNSELIKICDKFPNLKYGNRDLPKLEDILKLDEIINDYFKSHDVESTFRYFPIMLWWLITNIIPQRPYEFLLLKKDCLAISNIDGNDKYFINVSRRKFDNREESLEIDKITFNIIKNSINEIKTRFNNESPYLLTTEFYYHNQTRKHKRNKANQRLNNRDFTTLLDDFYEEVVKGLYNVDEIEKVRFGDTRHFAIINMCLQGFNMLSIADMAGHHDIYTQNGYFSHAKQFATSYVYLMAQKKVTHSFSKNNSNGLVGWKRFVYDKGKTMLPEELNSGEIVGHIDYGICVELKENFPENCIEDCRYCYKYYFNASISEFEAGIEWLINGSDLMKFKIENAIDFMQDLVGKSENNYNKAAQNLLQTTSRNLMNYMDLKTIVDIKIMESDKNHEF